MATDPHFEAYRLAMDPSLSADDKKAKIDMLFAAPPPPDPVVDERTAMNVPPSADGNAAMADWIQGQRSATDAPKPVPGVHAGPAQVGDVAHNIDAQPVPVPTGSTAVPAQPMGFAAQPETSAPVQQAAQEAAQPQVMPEDATNAAIGDALRASLRRPGGGGIVPEHDQLGGFTVEKQLPISPETQEAVDNARIDKEASLIAEGDEKAKAAEEEAKHYAMMASAEQARRDQMLLAQKQQREHLTALDENYKKVVADSEVAPNEWWTSKNTGQKITSVIGALMLGLGGHPEMVTQAIADDMAHRTANRNQRLSAARQAVDSFRGTMLSPEAAHQMEQSMSLQIAALQAKQLEAAAASPEAKARARAMVDDLTAQAANLRAEAERKEAGIAQQHFQHVAQHAVGGAPGIAEQAAALAKKTGIPFEKVMSYMVTNSPGQTAALPTDLRNTLESAMGRTVMLPDGTKLYARDVGEAKERQTAFDSAQEILNAYAQLRQFANQPGHSLSPSDLARINTIIAQNTVSLKNSNGLGQLTKSDEHIINPLSGADVGSTFALTSSVLAGLDQAEKLLRQKMSISSRSLFKEPFSNARTGGASPDAIKAKMGADK